MNSYGYNKKSGGVKEIVTLLVMMVIITGAFMLMNRIFYNKKTENNAKSDTTKTIVQDTTVKLQNESLSTVTSNVSSLTEEEKDILSFQDTVIYLLKNDNISVKISGVGTIKEIKLLNYTSANLKYIEIIKGFLSFYKLKRTKGVILFTGDGFVNKLFKPDSFVIDKGNNSSLVLRAYKDSFYMIKEFSLKEDRLVIKVLSNFKESFTFGGLSNTEPDTKSDLSYFKFAYLKEDKVYKIMAKKIKDRKVLSGNIDWSALTSKYFTIITKVKQYDSLVVFQKDRKSLWSLYAAGENEFVFYPFPLKDDLLVVYDQGFEELVPRSSGLLKPIAYLLFKLLEFFYKIFKNYGLAIIFFAVTIKITFFPLTHKSLKSMKKMKSVQGKIEELKKKYKDDPKQLNAEMMNLYKAHGVNPLSGCLPLLIQLPIFFALYAVLRNSFEMRGASFVWWIQDLSLRDPYYILPLLMGISSVLQSIITNPDSKQRFMQIF